MPLTVGSLFSGIGGIDLGLERAGMRVVWQSEVDPYASRVLAKHWPGVPNHGDITRIDFRAVEPVDVLAGGFPCQDISNAGQREGIDGERSGLWSEYARAIGELRPGYVFVENVAALLVRGLDRVLGGLAALGYDAEWDCIPAAAVGAPHLRDRVYVVAHAQRNARRYEPIALAERRRSSFAGHDGATWAVADAPRHRREQGRASSREDLRIFGRRSLARIRDWSPEPDVGRVADGVPARVDRLRGLGNAVVPQIPELIGGWIIEHARATGYLTEAA